LQIQIRITLLKKNRILRKIAQYLNVNKEQYSVLDQFVEKAATSDASPEEMQQQGF
jgi:hypothetical protein